MTQTSKHTPETGNKTPDCKNECKHTPGPWHARNDCGLAIDAWGGTVALVNTIEECGDADARLIAAAPDLLAALIETRDSLIDAYDDGQGARPTAVSSVIHRAEAAIAKARGEQEGAR